MLTNKQIYASFDFEQWAYKSNLLPAEKFILDSYLNLHGKTVEAGTGGGRILLELQKLGFTNLYGFDFVPELVQEAKAKDIKNSICFEIGDASKLHYEDNTFDQAIYLMQIISLIEKDLCRTQAIQEAYRILKKDGIALFSFLCLESRLKQPMYFLYILYLQFMRKTKKSHYTIQYQPWLKLGNKINFNALIDSRPYVYWYKIKEAYEILKAANFQIVGIGTDYQLKQGKILNSCTELMQDNLQGNLYFVCKK